MISPNISDLVIIFVIPKYKRPYQHDKKRCSYFVAKASFGALLNFRAWLCLGLVNDTAKKQREVGKTLKITLKDKFGSVCAGLSFV